MNQKQYLKQLWLNMLKLYQKKNLDKRVYANPILKKQKLDSNKK